MRSTILVLLALLVVPGCGGDEPAGVDGAPVEQEEAVPAGSPRAEEGPTDGGLVTDSLDGTYRVQVLLRGDAVVDGEWPLNEPFELEVRVTEGADPARIVRDVELRVDARMTVHGHGMKQDARAEQTPDGSWRAGPMLLHMTGPWELHVDVTRGALTERAWFQVVLE